MPKVGQRALYMLNSALFANLYNSKGKGLRKNTLNDNKLFFLTSLKKFIFFTPVGKQTIFVQKNQLTPPPPPQ